MPRWLMLGIGVPVFLALLGATRKLWGIPLGKKLSKSGRKWAGIERWEEFEDAAQAWVLRVFEGMDRDDAIRTVKAKRDLPGRRKR